MIEADAFKPFRLEKAFKIKSPQSSVFSLQSLRVFPNPASDNLTIVLDGYQDKTTIQVLDMVGRIVDEVEFTGLLKGVNTLEYDARFLEKGTYFVRDKFNPDVNTTMVISR